MSRARVVRVGLVVALAVMCMAVWLLFWRALALVQPVPAVIGQAPASLHAESVTFQSQSGSTIHGWFAPGARDRAVILLLAPVRSNRLAMLPRAAFLQEAGYSTLLIDFQATGESAGDAITFGWRERLDVLAAVDWLRQRVVDRPTVVLGASLGGAATILATPELDVEGVILEAVYPSIDVAIENRLRIRGGSLGAVAAPGLVWMLRPVLGIHPRQLRPIDRIGSLGCPVFVIGGARDLHTTEKNTLALYQAAAEPKRLWLIEDATHADFFTTAAEEYKRKVLGFIQDAAAARQAHTRTHTLPPTPAATR